MEPAAWVGAKFTVWYSANHIPGTCLSLEVAKNNRRKSSIT